MAEYILDKIFIGNVAKEAEERFTPEMTVDEMRTEFPNLVRSGAFVQAMEIVQGHGRFSWFYELFDSVQRKLFCKA